MISSVAQVTFIKEPLEISFYESLTRINITRRIARWKEKEPRLQRGRSARAGSGKMSRLKIPNELSPSNRNMNFFISPSGHMARRCTSFQVRTGARLRKKPRNVIARLYFRSRMAKVGIDIEVMKGLKNTSHPKSRTLRNQIAFLSFFSPHLEIVRLSRDSCSQNSLGWICLI